MVKFRRATLEDVGFLYQLRMLSMGEHLRRAGIDYSPAQHRARIFDHFDDSLLIFYQQQAIGLLKLGKLADRIHIRQLQLLPQWHGQGIGSQVLAIVKQQGEQRKLPITLNVLHQNPAKQLYLRHGFVEISKNEWEIFMMCPTKGTSVILSDD